MIKIAFYGNGSGATAWRFTTPAKYLLKSGKFDIRVPKEGMITDDLDWADIIITQGLVDKVLIATLYMAQQEFGKKIIVEFDDYTVAEDSSPHKERHLQHNAPEVMKIAMEHADMVTTTTDFLADKFKEHNKNVVVLPNCFDKEAYDMPIMENTEDTVRIGWFGSITHYEDFKLCAPALKRILKEYPNTSFTWAGDPRMIDYLKGCDNVECHKWTMMTDSLRNYAVKFNSMRWDIGLSPIRDTLFNKCKSNIKPMEYGVFKIPCIASDVGPYKDFGDAVVLAKTSEDWYRELKKMVEDKKHRKAIGKKMYDYVWENFDLEKNINKFIEAYTSLV